MRQAGFPVVKTLELAYAPPYGSAKDPINMLGFIAENLLTGTIETVQWHELDDHVRRGATVLDVRTTSEHAAGRIPGALNVDLDTLPSRLPDLPRGHLIVYCAVGQRGHTAAMLLGAHGRPVANLDGGYRTWLAGQAAVHTEAPQV